MGINFVLAISLHICMIYQFGFKVVLRNYILWINQSTMVQKPISGVIYTYGSYVICPKILICFSNSWLSSMEQVISFESHDYVCVLHTTLTCPFLQPLSVYCQLVRLILGWLLTALEACAGHGPPAELDKIQPPSPSIAGLIPQLVVWVGTVKYLWEPVDCWSTCKQ